ncbi:enoyl-CoA hydratase-related protein [Thauera aromatica]|uniref:enoyl-CoA hydratase-related protein n=1 Tax=Thauera aromatica TaxID=59405 RepID=UPI001FFC6C3B|nr:enoyl-CoA hydratase-related protein [Thauera aromatica]MCK2088298.1 enoyl-CoA hydratase-related protein [Thauera aromatica]
MTDKEASTKRRFTASILDKAPPGLRIGAEIPVIGVMPTWSVHLDNVCVGDDAVLGEVGDAFIPLQNRFGVRRIELAAHCIGMAERLIQMMIDQANLRKTFGVALADRQSVQNWIADLTVELKQVRLQLYFTAWKSDQGHKDLRITSTNAKFGLTEVKVASLAGLNGTQALPRAIPQAVAMKMLLTGEMISAEEALRYGLVSDVVEPSALAGLARTYAEKIVSAAPLSVQATKQAAVLGKDMPLEHGILYSHLLWGVLRDTEDRKEGFKAFGERRAPAFRGA